MKVLHVYQSYVSRSVGGLELAIEQIALATQGASCQPQVYFLAPKQDTAQKHGIEEIRGPLWRTLWSMAVPTYAGWRVLGKAMREADVIHYHLQWPIADLAHLVFRPRAPALATYHADLVRQKRVEPIYAWVRNAFFRKLRRIVVTTPTYGLESKALRGFSAKTVSIPLCLEDFDGSNLVRVQDAAPYFLFVGVLRYYKGLDTLLDAAKMIGLAVKIVGAGEHMAHLQRRIEAENIVNVKLCGRVSESEKRSLIQNCVALVLPSDSRAEAFGMVLLEAMRAQRPTITTNIASGMRYVCEDGVTGFTIPPNAPDALAAAMLRLSDAPELAAQLGRNGRARFLSHFTPQVVGQQYLDLYQQIVSEPPK